MILYNIGKRLAFINPDDHIGPFNVNKLLVTMHNYSPEDLLLYLYKETSPQATAEIEEALQNDWTLREKLAVLKTSMERLNTIVTPPRTEAVLNILKYANQQQQVVASSN